MKSSAIASKSKRHCQSQSCRAAESSNPIGQLSTSAAICGSSSNWILASGSRCSAVGASACTLYTRRLRRDSGDVHDVERASIPRFARQ